MNNCLDMPVCEHSVSLNRICEKCNSTKEPLFTSEMQRDVTHLLNRVNRLEINQVEAYRLTEKMENENDMQKDVAQLGQRVRKLEEHHVRQIDENRKISRRIDEAYGLIENLEKRVKDIEYRLTHIIALPSEIDMRLEEVERKLDKAFDKFCVKPHRCPVCDGSGGTIIDGVMDENCNGCEGKGIVWG